MNIDWLGHAGFRISDPSCVVYVDPYNIASGPRADIVLITHPHFDHCSPDDIESIHTEETLIVCAGDCNLPGEMRSVKPGESFDECDVHIQTIPAYNMESHYHPVEKDYVGYILTIAGTRIYHSGDSDLIPEMAAVECDIALLPVSGTYVMDARDAAKAASQINPRLAIPMHYGAGVIGSEEDAREFERLADVKVEIREIQE